MDLSSVTVCLFAALSPLDVKLTFLLDRENTSALWALKISPHTSSLYSETVIEQYLTSFTAQLCARHFFSGYRSMMTFRVRFFCSRIWIGTPSRPFFISPSKPNHIFISWRKPPDSPPLHRTSCSKWLLLILLFFHISLTDAGWVSVRTIWWVLIFEVTYLLTNQPM